MSASSLKRHTLVVISQQGRERTLSHFYHQHGSSSAKQQAAQLITGHFGAVQLPAIIRREDTNKVPGMIPVGFSSPFLKNGRRIRLPAFVYPEDIVDTISPYDLVKRNFVTRTPCLRMLAKLKSIAKESDIQLGAWGSAGLEIYTSIQYTHLQSDLDLLVAMSELKDMKQFFQVGMEFCREYGCRIDMEIDLPGGYGVQAAELFDKTEYVLAKGINDVIYISKNDLI